MQYFPLGLLSPIFDDLIQLKIVDDRWGMPMIKVIATFLLGTAIAITATIQASAKGQLYQSIEDIVKDAAVADFLTKEARRAGVRAIRDFPSSEHPKKIHPRQRNCGFATKGTVKIDMSRNICRTASYIAHELSHIAVHKRRCRGHGDVFYSYFKKVARRFEQAFPGYRWEGRSPTSFADWQSRNYRTPETCR